MSDPTPSEHRREVEIEGSLLIEGDGFSATVSGSRNLIYLELPSFGSLWKLKRFGSFRRFIRFASGQVSPALPLNAELRVKNRTIVRAFLSPTGMVARLTPIRFISGKNNTEGRSS